MNYSVVLVITSIHSLGMHEVSTYKIRINRGSPGQRLGPRRPAGGGDMGGYYHVPLSWGTGRTKAEASTALNLGFQIDIILSL